MGLVQACHRSWLCILTIVMNVGPLHPLSTFSALVVCTYPPTVPCSDICYRPFHLGHCTVDATHFFSVPLLWCTNLLACQWQCTSMSPCPRVLCFRYIYSHPLSGLLLSGPCCLCHPPGPAPTHLSLLPHTVVLASRPVWLRCSALARHSHRGSHAVYQICLFPGHRCSPFCIHLLLGDPCECFSSRGHFHGFSPYRPLWQPYQGEHHHLPPPRGHHWPPGRCHLVDPCPPLPECCSWVLLVHSYFSPLHHFVCHPFCFLHCQPTPTALGCSSSCHDGYVFACHPNAPLHPHDHSQCVNPISCLPLRIVAESHSQLFASIEPLYTLLHIHDKPQSGSSLPLVSACLNSLRCLRSLVLHSTSLVSLLPWWSYTDFYVLADFCLFGHHHLFCLCLAVSLFCIRIACMSFFPVSAVVWICVQIQYLSESVWTACQLW